MLTAEIFHKLPNFSLDISFSIENGILCILGPSGAGKTTILQALAGLQTLQQGEIVLDGKVLFSKEKKINVPPRLRKIGYVFQDYALFPHMTVKKNILYGVPKGCKCKEGTYRLSVLEVMDLIKITHLQDRYPHQLSGGEKQRVALARALMVEPDLLLLDEPLSALDEFTRATLQQELKELQRIWQISFVLVTHSKEEARFLADQTLYVNQGKKQIYEPVEDKDRGVPNEGYIHC